MLCKACGFDGPAPGFAAREMMFGLRESFGYETCPRCGTIQIATIPADLDRFYPKDYYSLASDEKITRPAPLKRAVASLLLNSPVPVFVTRPFRLKYPFLFWAAIAGKNVDAAYLDVGCGGGRLLRRMKKCGFSNLTGIDPYAPRDVSEPGLTIRRAGISSVQGEFDLIILSHVLEHLPDPVGTLTMARRLLTRTGVLLIRVPIAGSAICREYGPHWFNLDPPRHLFVPSVRGMELVAAKAGLKVKVVVFDSMEDSILMSENYRNDIPMVSAPPVSRAKRMEYRERAEEQNKARTADLAAIFLTAN